MIVVPSCSTPAPYRLYPDAEDEALTYVDTLQATPVHQEAIRWLQLCDRQVSAVGEVQFGPDTRDFKALENQHPSARSASMPWQSGPVYVWTQQQNGIQMLATGKTSGYGSHNAVFNSTTELKTAHKRIGIAAELSCSGQLAQANLQAGGKLEVIEEALSCLPLGDRAPKMATLADVLLPVLQQLVNLKGLVILAKAKALSIGALEELRQLVLTEWAHRIINACEGKPLSLAMPAAEVNKLKLNQPLNLEINWSSGEVVPIRVVRTLRVQGLGPQREEKQRADDDNNTIKEIEVAVKGNWQSFDYVEVSLSNTHGHADITLTADKAAQRCQLPPGENVQAIALAGVRRFGVRVPIETIQVKSKRVTVTLEPLKEKAFLVKAARSLLQKLGPLEINITHPAIAKVLVPRKKNLTLCASQGDLNQVSAVYRALMWQNQQLSDPFNIAVQPVRGPCIQWTETDIGDEIMISPKQLGIKTQ